MASSTGSVRASGEVRRSILGGSRLLGLLWLSAFVAASAFAQVQFVGRQDTKGTVFVPSSVALDAAGNVYVTDVGTGAIYKIDPFGNQTTVGGATGLWAVALDAAGNIYYTNFGNNCVEQIPVGGGGPNCLGAGLSGPVGIAVDAAGNIYVADNGNARVVKIAAGGGQSTLLNGLATVSSVAVDKSGNIYAVRSSSANIFKIPPGGGSFTMVGAGLTGPQGVAVDADGNVYVCQSNNNVAKITPAGAQSALPVTGLNNPLIPAVDANGNLYIPSRNIGTVTVFNTQLAALGYAEVCSGGSPAPCSQTATLNFDFGSDTFASAAYLTGGIAGLDFSQASTTCTALSTSCSIVVRFATGVPGPRAGAVVVMDSGGNTVNVPLSGVGFAAEASFGPPVVLAPFGNGAFEDTPSIAVDNSGDFYIADNISCQVYKIDTSQNFSVIAGTGTCGYAGDGAAATAPGNSSGPRQHRLRRGG